MSRQIKSLPTPDHGFKHREHRSKLGRERYTAKDWAARKELFKLKEKERLEEMKIQEQILKEKWI